MAEPEPELASEPVESAEEADERQPLAKIPQGTPPEKEGGDAAAESVFLEEDTQGADQAQATAASKEQRAHRTRMWTNFAEQHPGVNNMQEFEQRALFAAIDAKRQAKERAEQKKHDLGLWSAQVLANCSAIMSDKDRPEIQKYTASMVCTTFMYLETIFLGVVPVIVTGLLLKQLDSNSQAFVLCLLPFPFLIQMLFATILTKIDNTRHRLWILPAAEIAKALTAGSSRIQSFRGKGTPSPRPESQSERVEGEQTEEMKARLAKATADKLEELNELQHGQQEMAKEAELKAALEVKQKEFESLPPDAPIPDVDRCQAQLDDLRQQLADAQEQILETHAREATAGLAPRVPVARKARLKNRLKKSAKPVQSCKAGCTAIFLIDGVEEEAIIPDPVSFPAEMKHTWKREFLVLFIAFMAVTVLFAFSSSGKVALSSCGFGQLYMVHQREVSYRLVGVSQACGAVEYVTADPKLSDGGLVTRKKCAALAHARGVSFFNYAAQCIDGHSAYEVDSSDLCVGQCVTINTTDASCPSCPAPLFGNTMTCERDQIFGGASWNPDWDLFEVVGVNSDIDSCNCGPGFGWSTELGRCDTGSRTDEDEALRCLEGPPLYAESIYTIYMCTMMLFTILYSLVIAWIEHDIVFECPSWFARRNEETQASAQSSGSVVIARARRPPDTSAHEANMKKWREAINKVEEIQKLKPSLIKGMQRHMHPLWMTVLLVLIVSSFIFYLFYIRYAIELYNRTVNEGTRELDETKKLLQLDADPFFKVCIEAYTAARDSDLAMSLGQEADQIEVAITELCHKIQTPDLLSTHCSTSTWADIDSNAPWLRALLTVLLASIIPALVGAAVGEGIEAMFTLAFPALTKDNAYILFFLNFLINSNVTRYLIFQFSTSSGQSKDQDNSSAVESSAINSSSIFLVVYLAFVELFLRNTWKLRKKLVCLFKSEFLGARRKKGETWEEYFESEWNDGVEVRAQLDVAKSKVECWSILIIAAALVIHGDPSCSIGSILGYQFMQLVAEFLTDVVCLKRLIKKHLNPVNAMISKNRMASFAELAAFLIVGNGLMLTLPTTQGWAITQTLFCDVAELSALC